jgi:hypothetical protein
VVPDKADIAYMQKVAAIVGAKLANARREHAVAALEDVTADFHASPVQLYQKACEALLATVLFAKTVQVWRVSDRQLVTCLLSCSADGSTDRKERALPIRGQKLGALVALMEHAHHLPEATTVVLKNQKMKADGAAAVGAAHAAAAAAAAASGHGKGKKQPRGREEGSKATPPTRVTVKVGRAFEVVYSSLNRHTEALAEAASKEIVAAGGEKPAAVPLIRLPDMPERIMCLFHDPGDEYAAAAGGGGDGIKGNKGKGKGGKGKGKGKGKGGKGKGKGGKGGEAAEAEAEEEEDADRHQYALVLTRHKGYRWAHDMELMQIVSSELAVAIQCVRGREARAASLETAQLELAMKLMRMTTEASAAHEASVRERRRRRLAMRVSRIPLPRPPAAEKNTGSLELVQGGGGEAAGAKTKIDSSNPTAIAAAMLSGNEISVNLSAPLTTPPTPHAPTTNPDGTTSTSALAPPALGGQYFDAVEARRQQREAEDADAEEVEERGLLELALTTVVHTLTDQSTAATDTLSAAAQEAAYGHSLNAYLGLLRPTAQIIRLAESMRFAPQPLAVTTQLKKEQRRKQKLIGGPSAGAVAAVPKLALEGAAVGGSKGGAGEVTKSGAIVTRNTPALSLTGRELLRPRGVAFRSVERLTAVVVPDAAAARDQQVYFFGPHDRIRWPFVCVPVTSGGAAIGVLGVDGIQHPIVPIGRPGDERQPEQGVVQFITKVGAMVGRSIDSLRKRRQLRRLTAVSTDIIAGAEEASFGWEQPPSAHVLSPFVCLPAFTKDPSAPPVDAEAALEQRLVAATARYLRRFDGHRLVQRQHAELQAKVLASSPKRKVSTSDANGAGQAEGYGIGVSGSFWCHRVPTAGLLPSTEFVATEGAQAQALSEAERLERLQRQASPFPLLPPLAEECLALAVETVMETIVFAQEAEVWCLIFTQKKMPPPRGQKSPQQKAMFADEVDDEEAARRVRFNRLVQSDGGGCTDWALVQAGVLADEISVEIRRVGAPAAGTEPEPEQKLGDDRWSCRGEGEGEDEGLTARIRPFAAGTYVRDQARVKLKPSLIDAMLEQFRVQQARRNGGGGGAGAGKKARRDSAKPEGIGGANDKSMPFCATVGLGQKKSAGSGSAAEQQRAEAEAKAAETRASTGSRQGKRGAAAADEEEEEEPAGEHILCCFDDPMPPPKDLLPRGLLPDVASGGGTGGSTKADSFSDSSSSSSSSSVSRSGSSAAGSAGSGFFQTMRLPCPGPSGAGGGGDQEAMVGMPYVRRYPYQRYVCEVQKQLEPMLLPPGAGPALTADKGAGPGKAAGGDSGGSSGGSSPAGTGSNGAGANGLGARGIYQYMLSVKRTASHVATEDVSYARQVGAQLSASLRTIRGREARERARGETLLRIRRLALSSGGMRNTDAALCRLFERGLLADEPSDDEEGDEGGAGGAGGGRAGGRDRRRRRREGAAAKSAEEVAKGGSGGAQGAGGAGGKREALSIEELRKEAAAESASRLQRQLAQKSLAFADAAGAALAAAREADSLARAATGFEQRVSDAVIAEVMAALTSAGSLGADGALANAKGQVYHSMTAIAPLRAPHVYVGMLQRGGQSIRYISASEGSRMTQGSR